MSPFTDLADPAEVEAELAQLRADIDSGEIAKVLGRYAHAGGNYTFVIAA